MNTSQLMCVIHSDPRLFASVRGVYSADQVPKYIRRGGFIANTDVGNKPGKHWCAFYFDGFGRSEFFDSYGKPPQYYNNDFLSCLRRNSGVWIYNTKKLQSHYSNVCGQYCLYFLIHRVRGQSFGEIVKTLEESKCTDQYVYDYVTRIFPYCFTDLNS
ncbi:MAG: hypothetical protein AB2693_33480, partial [Candidatus Thiodiazotropha sp.]